MKEYIDKEKLLAEIQAYKNKICWNAKEFDKVTIMRVLSVVENFIKHQEKKRGYWTKEVSYIWHCSECLHTALLDGGEEYVLSNFCPHCGAKMDRKEV